MPQMCRVVSTGHCIAQATPSVENPFSALLLRSPRISWRCRGPGEQSLPLGSVSGASQSAPAEASLVDGLRECSLWLPPRIVPGLGKASTVAWFRSRCGCRLACASLQKLDATVCAAACQPCVGPHQAATNERFAKRRLGADLHHRSARDGTHAMGRARSTHPTFQLHHLPTIPILCSTGPQCNAHQLQLLTPTPQRLPTEAARVDYAVTRPIALQCCSDF